MQCSSTDGTVSYLAFQKGFDAKISSPWSQKKSAFQENSGTKIVALSEVAVFHVLFWPPGIKSYSTSDYKEGV